MPKKRDAHLVLDEGGGSLGLGGLSGVRDGSRDGGVGGGGVSFRHDYLCLRMRVWGAFWKQKRSSEGGAKAERVRRGRGRRGRRRGEEGLGGKVALRKRSGNENAASASVANVPASTAQRWRSLSSNSVC